MNDNRTNTPELSTPKITDHEDVTKSPLSGNMEQIDLNITNLEGSPEMKNKSSIKSSPTTNININVISYSYYVHCTEYNIIFIFIEGRRPRTSTYCKYK